jgi:hypothetical protein
MNAVKEHTTVPMPPKSHLYIENSKKNLSSAPKLKNKHGITSYHSKKSQEAPITGTS